MLLPKHYGSPIDLWSVGCILGEILGRKPMFPGKNHVDMIVRVSQKLGTPSDDDLNWLPRDSDAYRFVRRVCPKSGGVTFSSEYPRAPRACLDLLRALLTWDPARRLTAAEALDHEYVRRYRKEEKAGSPEPFDWGFDGFKATQSAVKERLYRECARFHPEILQRDSPASVVPPARAASPADSRRLVTTLPPRPRCVTAPSDATHHVPTPDNEAANRRHHEQLKDRQRQLSGGYPQGPPSRLDYRPLSARSSDGHSMRTLGLGHHMAPSHSMIPQPCFGARAAHGTPTVTGRSLTPQRQRVAHPGLVVPRHSEVLAR